MARVRGCPIPDLDAVDDDGNPEYFVVLPDEWLGVHARRRDEAAEMAEERGLTRTLTNFAVCMALLDDWNLPGLGGNPEKWDFERVRLDVIGWVNGEVLGDFLACFRFGAVLSPPSRNGSNQLAKATAPGSSTATE